MTRSQGAQRAHRQSRRFARRDDARLCRVGQHRAPVAARRRRAARAGRPPAERQWHRLHARRARGGDGELRPHAAHLAACRRQLAHHRHAAVAAQCGGGRAGRRDRHGRRHGQGLFPLAQGEIKGEVEAAAVPIIALALSGDGKLVAASSVRGAVAIIDRAGRKLERTLVGPGLPAWSVAFLPDNRTLLTGGTDRLVRRWDARQRRAHGRGGRWPARRSTGRLRGRSRRRGVPRLRRLPHPEGRRRPARGADAGRHLRAQDRDLCRATTSPRRSRSSTSCGRPRRCRSCSRWGPPPTRPAPRCPSSASAPRIARRW